MSKRGIENKFCKSLEEEGLWASNSPRDTKSHPAGFPGGAVVENLPANAGGTGSSPGMGRSHMPRSN